MRFISFNKWFRLYLNPNHYPTNRWYRTHLDRNFDFVVLGNSDTLDTNFHISNKKCWDWRLRNQTLLWDYNVLKHFHSILKPHGLVLFNISSAYIHSACSEVKDKRPYYFEYMTFVPIDSKFRNIYIKIVKRIPFLMATPMDLYFYLKYIFFGKHVYKEYRYSCCKVKDILKLIEDIREFCIERELQPLFISDESDIFKDEIIKGSGVNVYNTNQILDILQND